MKSSLKTWKKPNVKKIWTTAKTAGHILWGTHCHFSSVHLFRLGTFECYLYSEPRHSLYSSTWNFFGLKQKYKPAGDIKGYIRQSSTWVGDPLRVRTINTPNSMSIHNTTAGSAILQRQDAPSLHTSGAVWWAIALNMWKMNVARATCHLHPSVYAPLAILSLAKWKKTLQISPAISSLSHHTHSGQTEGFVTVTVFPSVRITSVSAFDTGTDLEGGWGGSIWRMTLGGKKWVTFSTYTHLYSIADGIIVWRSQTIACSSILQQCNPPACENYCGVNKRCDTAAKETIQRLCLSEGSCSMSHAL